MAPCFALRTELLRRVSKETRLALTKPPRIACTRAVPRGVNPVLKNTVSQPTRISLITPSVSKRWTSGGTVGYPAWVPPLCLLATVRVGAVGPVVAADPRAPPDLVHVHAELIGAVDCLLDIVVALAMV